MSTTKWYLKFYPFLIPVFLLVFACNSSSEGNRDEEEGEEEQEEAMEEMMENQAQPKPISAPLVTDIYTADPSAHVFENKLYIYPSHDWEAGIPENDLGDHFGMVDYHVLSMDQIGGPVTDHGVALDI